MRSSQDIDMLKENEYHWFPMRIRNSSIARLQQMKERLDLHKGILEGQGITFDTYTPLGLVKLKSSEIKLAPCLVNYIFVYSTLMELKSIKKNLEIFEPLRFVMHPARDEKMDVYSEVLYIPDRNMQDFIRVTKEENDKVIFLDNMEYACKVSREVQITQGPFSGVIGHVKRIKGMRCVVLLIGNEMAAAVVDVPNKYLRYLTDEEVNALETDNNHQNN